MNPILAKQALEKVQNPHILINIVARRVRQLTDGSGGSSAPLITDVANLCHSDVALLEIIQGKLSYELPEIIPLTRPTARGRNVPKNWQTHAKAA